MQLNITTDYAIRVILYLGSHAKNEIVTSLDIAEALNIPHNYLAKVLRKLKEHGLIISISGSKGGYILGKDLETISLSEVLHIMERTMNMNCCLEPAGRCSRSASDSCKVRLHLLNAHKMLEKDYFSATMDQFLSGF